MWRFQKCKDNSTTRWDGTTAKCVPCTVKPGYEITPHCGYGDDGGIHYPGYKKCEDKKFNDGSWTTCQPCTSCPPGYDILSPCNTTTDTQCYEPRKLTTEVPVTPSTPQHVSTLFSKATTVSHVKSVQLLTSSQTQTNQGPSSTLNAATTSATPWVHPPVHPGTGAHWAVPLTILISIMLALLSACIIYKKWRGGQPRNNKRRSFINDGFSPLPAPTCNNDLGYILSPDVLSAPLQTVLDNLDILEELVILLDPDSHGVKSTRHLASHCSFSSTWINYTYSMKDSKSPLKAVLEGVTSRHPDWTVGHLAKLLREMERNDAVAVLAKLRLNEIAV
ncbi:IGF-like family receptor 1 isoform X2 [Lates calcarifer]|uniref:IGF-like family receptor 1 n=1 Tax=Lates calcarifer TaxID=8187 RepID=A0A4W6CYI0_LATCA|nr:IGF-like family receptor 1 isoform X2 [Lates calcarifer]